MIPGIHPGRAPGATGTSGPLELVLGWLDGDVAVLAGVGLEPGDGGGIWDCVIGNYIMTEFIYWDTILRV